MPSDTRPFAPIPLPDVHGIDWQDLGRCSHFVQFYDSENFLCDSVAKFLTTGFLNDENGLIIATPEHCQGIKAAISKLGFKPEDLERSGKFTVLDASQTLDRFMKNGMPNRDLFRQTVGSLVKIVLKTGRLRAFGEMVSLLWAEGKANAAIKLEELWNEIGVEMEFSLLCAYPMQSFEGDVKPFMQVCGCHKAVIPSESYLEASVDPERSLAAPARIVDETKRTEHLKRLLEQNQLLLSLAVDLGQLGLWELNRSTNEIWGCEMFKNQLSLPDGPACQLEDFLALIHPDDRCAVEATINYALQSGKASSVEYRVEVKGKPSRFLRSRMQTGEKGALLGFSMDMNRR